jgi:hypothetical protein
MPYVGSSVGVTMAKITIGAVVLLGVAAAVFSTYFAPAYALNPF